uniref:Family with sequence similarity 185 member A n=1 Tax=Malurus cyaneus samueli TaxID=2593467 RepID=A0A8C5TNP0_9PASS
MRALAPRWAALAVGGAGVAPPSPARSPGRPRSAPPREWALSVNVRPLDPQRCPGADRGAGGPERRQPRTRGRERDPVRVEHDEELGQVAIVADGVDSKATVDVRTPVKFDLDIKTSGTGCVKIQKIECDNCKIETEKGTSVLQSIKSVNIEKLQGTAINISTEDGLLKTKYLYAESASLSSESGDIMLGSVHVLFFCFLDSSDGSLKASTYHGTIDVYVSQLRKVDLKSQKGSITVKVPESLKAYLELSGRKVDVSSEIQLKETQSASKDDHVTLSDKWIKADTQNGKVYLKSQSWIQSVKLKTLHQLDFR